MFRPIESSNAPTITFTFDDQPVTASEGMTIAAALLAAGYLSLRETPVSGQARGPFCMMGACFDCLVQIDGETQQACMVQVRSGLRVSRILRAIDNTGAGK
jgi:D-hydroxyproline dehydrogenase subunit gamma